MVAAAATADQLIGADRGAVFSFHRPEVWEVAGVEMRGSMYHAVEVAAGRITRIIDHAERTEALAAVGLGDD